MYDPQISVIIGIRDWDMSRVEKAIQSIQKSFGTKHGEVVISDYGSKDPSHAEDLARKYDTKLVYTSGDPVWSRSRALNAGFRAAEGNILVSTDADMLFGPKAFEAIYDEYVATRPCAMFLQCRDLNEATTTQLLRDDFEIDWESVEYGSILRPRWGMGGMMAIDRDGFEQLNGFDERLHTYGREDMDFAVRARRAGYRTNWVQDPRARMYHMWHPRFTDASADLTQRKHIIERNRRIVDGDDSIARNLTKPEHVAPSVDETILVTIAIYDDEFSTPIDHTMATLLAQTIRKTEVLILAHPKEYLALSRAYRRNQRVRVIELESDDPSTQEFIAKCASSSRGHYLFMAANGFTYELGAIQTFLRDVTDGAIVAIEPTNSPSNIPKPNTWTLSSGSRGTTPSLLARTKTIGTIMNAATPDSISSIPQFLSILEQSGLKIRQSAELMSQHRNVSNASYTDDRIAVSDYTDNGGATHSLDDAQLFTVKLNVDIAALQSLTLDGKVNHVSVKYLSTILHQESIIKNATYSDLIRLSELDPSMEVTPSHLGDENIGIDWLLKIIEHQTSIGRDLPYAISYCEPQSYRNDIYEIVSSESSTSIAIIREHDIPQAGASVWLSLGTTATEALK